MNFVVIVAAGTGSRMNSSLPKQFLELNGRPVLMHSIERFSQSQDVSEIILVISREMEEFWKALCMENQFDEVYHLVYGGKSRFESVRNGILYIQEHFQIGNNDYIAVHDGARPIISSELIARAFHGAYQHHAVVLAQSSVESVRIGNPRTSNALDRNQVWLVQTPQVFQAELLINAYCQPEDPLFTDDASVVEKMGNSVAIVEGDPKNIKITYPQDLQIAQFYLSLPD
ncbi:2-C-methyl-D-erythritol 4-phosphate cytidylyltransferase [Sphingobacterium thalpophilum]|uniref:2-C-methyl-D-erythritol 4-phosphate cytidylyltransferase n=1 Tax=Sphingobacterium thalpophilum TaxID=259 RepID=UPI0024A75AEA|nr:2-C-methyl-D-erythritol 4-phosphate cytidylyltransferase [Sphingobacterium thalpophilum]